MNFAILEDSGENQKGFTLERRATNIIDWRFEFANRVRLLIINKGTLE
ncbi:MAG: hypothetical protein ACFFG0_23385 [Candidatus Thorarchaeota archaeon]